MVNFEEHFWGDKYNGFEVLQHNFKLGLNTGKEFAEFLKERSSIEETYSKSLLKLANKCASANLHVGTFEPCWKILQSSTEKLANVHSQIIQNLNDVSKSVRDYGELQREKQKQMKDDFASTAEAVLNLQHLSSALIKAREGYLQRSQEVEKCRKDLTNLKDIKNAELKYKKSTDDYKQLVDKRESARVDFCEKVTDISVKLQAVEEEHLTTMLDILSKYGETLKTERFLLDQIIDEFGRNMIALTVENLLQQFINLKQTGKGCPLPVDFEESSLQSKPVDLDAMELQLKEEKKKRKTEKREKKAERKKKKEKAAANGTVEEGSEESQESHNEIHLVDADGYIIRPPDSDSLHSGHNRDSFSSDSDSEDSDAGQKITVRIKPVEEMNTMGSNSDLSLEDLNKFKNLRLMSPSTVHQNKIQLEDKKFTPWGSDGTLNKKSKSNIDLLNMDKNSDTASIHSLPVNSSFPTLNTTSELTDTGITDQPFGESSTSSPIGSPPDGNNLSGGSGSLSPSPSFDKSVKSLESIEKSSTDELNTIDALPPLPLKAKSLPHGGSGSLTNYDSSIEEIDSKDNSLLDISTPSPVNNSNNNSEENIELEETTSTNDIIKNEVPEKIQLSIPDKLSQSSNTRTFPNLESLNLEPLKPPPIEKRHTPLPLPHGSSTRALPSNIATAVPRPKASTQVLPPTVTSKGASLPTASSTSSLPNTISSKSFFSDLLDINFSPATTSIPATTLSTSSSSSSLTLKTENEEVSCPPISTSSEQTTCTPAATSNTQKLTEGDVMSTWVNPSESPDPISTWVKPDEGLEPVVDKTIKEELLSDQESAPPIVPRRGQLATKTPGSVTAVSIVNLSAVDRAIPIAVAFTESVNGVLKGSDEKSCVIKVTGDMTISFPANMISLLSSSTPPPALSFLVSGTTSLEQIFPNKQLVERSGQLPGGDGMLFKFNMTNLAAYLKKQAEQGSKATYYNIDILKYQVRCYGNSTAPLQMSSYWRCDPKQTDLIIEYTYNSSCMSSPVALNNVSVVAAVDGGVEIMQSKPSAIWSSEQQRCMWKIASISESNDNAGALRARFDVTRGPTTPVPIFVQFTGEGSTISALNFDITLPAYKLSLVKKRFASGRYLVESS